MEKKGIIFLLVFLLEGLVLIEGKGGRGGGGSRSSSGGSRSWGGGSRSWGGGSKTSGWSSGSKSTAPVANYPRQAGTSHSFGTSHTPTNTHSTGTNYGWNVNANSPSSKTTSWKPNYQTGSGVHTGTATGSSANNYHPAFQSNYRPAYTQTGTGAGTYTHPSTINVYTSGHVPMAPGYAAVYSPVYVPVQSGSGIGSGTSFLGGYMLGRMTSGSNHYYHGGYGGYGGYGNYGGYGGSHVTNNHYYGDRGSSFNRDGGSEVNRVSHTNTAAEPHRDGNVADVSPIQKARNEKYYPVEMLDRGGYTGFSGYDFTGVVGKSGDKNLLYKLGIPKTLELSGPSYKVVEPASYFKNWNAEKIWDISFKQTV